MKIALIAPPYPLEEAPSPPLGLCYVAAACEKAGAQVRIFDYIVSKYSPEKLCRELDAFRPDAIGSTAVTMNFPSAANIIKAAKGHNPDMITMMGGPHVSFDIEGSFRAYPEIDLIVRGEGEETLSELIPVINEKSAWDDINGIAFRRQGQIVATEERELIKDLDSLPLPARHLLPMSRYQALGFPVSIITSRGCPNKCIFCLGRKMVGYKARFRSPAIVVDEIEHILSYGFTRINIADDLFTASKKRVRELCEEINRRGVKFDWSAFARVNTVDLEILKVMKSAGCDSISFGIESGNPEMLKRIKKGITLEQAREAVRSSKEAGMITHASFMVGLPGESPKTLTDTSRFAEELDIPYGYHYLSPFPGTTVREDIDEYDLEILTDDWSRYDANSAIVRTSQVTPDEMTAFVANYDNQIANEWDETVRAYNEDRDNCSEKDYFQVEGRKRMDLIYRILSEDLIEETRCTGSGSRDSLSVFSSSIADRTGIDKTFVTKTVKSLIQAGYIKPASADVPKSFFWTHNRFQDTLPVS